jgi:hypothetical protein
MHGAAEVSAVLTQYGAMGTGAVSQPQHHGDMIFGSVLLTFATVFFHVDANMAKHGGEG